MFPDCCRALGETERQEQKLRGCDENRVVGAPFPSRTSLVPAGGPTRIMALPKIVWSHSDESELEVAACIGARRRHPVQRLGARSRAIRAILLAGGRRSTISLRSTRAITTSKINSTTKTLTVLHNTTASSCTTKLENRRPPRHASSSGPPRPANSFGGNSRDKGQCQSVLRTGSARPV